MTSPVLSVVMPVRNGMPYLQDSLRSILDQTYRDFELVILTNGSTDGSRELAEAAARDDARVRVIARPEAMGVAGSSNETVSISSAPLIARMDADDICDPRRLEKQLEAISSDPHVVLVGTLWDGIEASGRKVRPRDRSRLLASTTLCPFTHGSVMFRRDAFERIGGYRKATEGWADLDLFIRLGEIGKIEVLTEPLYGYRFHNSMISLGLDGGMTARAIAVRTASLSAYREGQEWLGIAERPDLSAEAVATAAAQAKTTFAALNLWAGQRPQRTPTRRGHVYASLGSLSPRALRATLALAIRIRDLIAGIRLGFPEKVEWRYQRS